jgi:hypothetical protein
MLKATIKLAVFMIILVQAGNASAIYTYVNGRWIVGSVVCDALLKSVPNPDVKPGQIECVASTALIDVLCKNPTGKQVLPGQSAIQQVLVGQKQIDQGDITDKVKGKAEVKVELSDDPLLKPEFCVNTNWTPIDVLVRVFTGTMNAYSCTGPSSDPCSEKVLENTRKMNCALPASYGFDNYPANVPPAGTPYDCSLQ